MNIWLFSTEIYLYFIVIDFSSSFIEIKLTHNTVSLRWTAQWFDLQVMIITVNLVNSIS